MPQTERQSRASLLGLRRLCARWRGERCTSDDTGVLTIGSASPFGWAAMAALREHRWAGNARELRNVVESALAMGRIELEGAPSEELHSDARPSYRDARAVAVERFERAFLTELMTTEADGNASEAARRARMDRPYLLTRLRKHGMR